MCQTGAFSNIQEDIQTIEINIALLQIYKFLISNISKISDSSLKKKKKKKKMSNWCKSITFNILTS